MKLVRLKVEDVSQWKWFCISVFLADKYLGKALILTKLKLSGVVKSKYLFLVYCHLPVTQSSRVGYGLTVSFVTQLVIH